jgi:hypothetical protein
MTTDLNKHHVSKIFKHLKEGKFLTRNTPNKEHQKLFVYIETHYHELSEFFSYLDMTLVLKEGYVYFASYDNREKKMTRILELIDYLSFFYHYDPTFGVGTHFNLHQIEEKIKEDITLKTKFERLKELKSDTLQARIKNLITKFEKQGFVVLEDEYYQSYIVVDSFAYFVDFFNNIEIKA